MTYASPVVRVHKHTDNSLFGAAQASSIEFQRLLNGYGVGKVTIACELLRDVHWDQTVDLDLGGTIVERVWAWSRPNVIKIVDTTGTLLCDFIVESVSFDYDGKPDFWQGNVTLSGRGTGSCLEYASVVVADHAIRLETGRPRAALISDFIDEAQLRDCIPNITIGFDDTDDSDGNAWTDADQIRIRSGGTIGQKITEWGDYGWDWAVLNFVVDLWITAGQDLTSTVILFPGRHFVGTSLTESWDYQSVYSTFQGEVAGAPSSGSAEYPSIVARFGRRESWQSQGYAPEEFIDGLIALAEAASHIPVSRTVTVDPTVAGAIPGTDFQLGDTVAIAIGSPKDQTSSSDAVVKSPARVMGWAYKLANDGAETCELVLDTILAHTRRKWIAEIDNQEGTIATPNLEGVAYSTYTGEPDEPFTAQGPTKPYGGIIRTDTTATDGKGAIGVIPPTNVDFDGAAIGVNFHEVDGGTLGMTVIQAGASSGGPGPAIYLDPNVGTDGEIRFYPPLSGGGWLPDWYMLHTELGASAGSDVNSFNTPSTGTDDEAGSRLRYRDYDLLGYLEVVQQSWDGAVIADINSVTDSEDEFYEASTTWRVNTGATFGSNYALLRAIVDDDGSRTDALWRAQAVNSDSGTTATTLLGTIDVGSKTYMPELLITALTADGSAGMYFGPTTSSGDVDLMKFGVFDKGTALAAAVQQTVSASGSTTSQLNEVITALVAFGFVRITA